MNGFATCELPHDGTTLRKSRGLASVSDRRADATARSLAGRVGAFEGAALI